MMINHKLSANLAVLESMEFKHAGEMAKHRLEWYRFSDWLKLDLFSNG